MTQSLAALTDAGVSIWLDDLSRERLTSGSLADLVTYDRVSGFTTNLSIFAKAIHSTADYEAQVRDLAVRGIGAGEALRALTTYDVRWACYVLCTKRLRCGRASVYRDRPAPCGSHRRDDRRGLGALCGGGSYPLRS